MKSKHSHLRYNLLDHYFQRLQKPMTFDEILNSLNDALQESYPGESVSERTLREDIKLFRDTKAGFAAPLETLKLRGKNVYVYSDKDFTIANRSLLPEEQHLLDKAHQLIERFENHPKYDKLSEAMIFIEEESGVTNSSKQEKILFYDTNEAYEGIRLLKPLFHAVRKKQVLRIHFIGFQKEEVFEYIFHPYILKQYNQRWFLYGYNETRDIKKWSVPLDQRLVSFEILENLELKKDTTNWDAFFREMIGVRRQDITKPKEEAKPETIVLKFAPHRINYFRTKPIHPDFDDSWDFENQVFFDAIINPELVQQIFSYGNDVEVIAPNSLRELMKEKVMEMSKRYYEEE